MANLVKQKLGVINVGLEQFADAISTAGGAVTQLQWEPPAQGDVEAGMALARLTNAPEIELANEQAFAAFVAASPRLRSVAKAATALSGLGERTLLHAGPPIAWARMCGPMQGAIVGAILYEGWASDDKAARALAASGEIVYQPCHHYAAVGPMAGVISPSMPLWIVEDPATGARAFSNLNEGLGKALRFGAYGDEVLTRLKWIENTLAPALRAALETFD